MLLGLHDHEFTASAGLGASEPEIIDGEEQR
jgi:hypothetical protein